MSALLEVRNLKTEFNTPIGKVVAVNDVSFDVDEGEIVAVVGESGSGKSITAMSVLGLVPDPPGKVVDGSVRFDGKDLVALPDRELRDIRGRDIGTIFQEPMTALNPVLTIGQQLTEPLVRHLGCDEAEAQKLAVTALTQVKMSDPERRLSQYPHHLSGGMRQRVMIAMALICNPKLIIADEPTTALDVTVQAQILELIKEMSVERGVAVILITHNLGIVARYAHRVNVMYAGRVVESGTADEIFHGPKHPYTIALLESLPRLDIDQMDRLVALDGHPPNLADLPEGCAFAPRCRFRQDDCLKAVPPYDQSTDHAFACWHPRNAEATV